MQWDSKQHSKKQISGPTETWAAQELHNWGVHAIWASLYHETNCSIRLLAVGLVTAEHTTRILSYMKLAPQ